MSEVIEQKLVDVICKTQAMSATFKGIGWTSAPDCELDQGVLSGYGLIIENITDDIQDILEAVQLESKELVT
jgi:hypothetical protein